MVGGVSVSSKSPMMILFNFKFVDSIFLEMLIKVESVAKLKQLGGDAPYLCYRCKDLSCNRGVNSTIFTYTEFSVECVCVFVRVSM